MMLRIFFGISLIAILSFYGCGTSNPVLATIGDEKITLSYFEDNYAKNNGGWDTCAVSSMEDRQRFLDLLVKFKLKVKEARSQGLEKDSAVISEMESYHTSVAQSYMIEKEIIEPGMRQLYNRKNDEVHASHILIRLQPNATPDDTLKAYNQAMSIIGQIPQVPFDTLAYKYSEDPSAKTNYGNLGFFSGGRMVPEFEDGCYSLNPGEYSKTPVRSQFGYHIIKVVGHRQNPGSVHISHILIRFNEGASDTAAVRDTIWMVYHKLKSGAKFTEMVQKYSQDPQKASNNGDIGLYESDRLPPKIADLFYNMKVDSFSEPMQFNYGYHIFKLTERKPLPPYEEMEKDLKDTYKKVRFDYEFNRLAREVKEKYHVRIDSSVVRTLIASVDTTKVAGMYGWRDTLTANILNRTIIQRTGRPFTVNNFVDRVVESNDYKNNILTPSNIWQITNKLLDVVAVEEYARHAPEKYPILSKLLKEYEEGILLYRVEQDEVWKKVMVNDSLLKEYYAMHKEEYRWPERVNFAEIFTLADSTAKAAYWKLKFGEDFLNVAQEYTNRSGYQEKKGVWGFQPYAANELSSKAAAMALDSVSEPFQYQSGWSILKTLAKDSARVKSFEEATSEVASGYQEQATKKREQDWIESLKKKYPVSVNNELLKEAFKRKRVENQ
jgi:peptidyl-prolyl cis-trans isomerase SurA